MALTDINWRPTGRQLRQFGWICLVAFPFIGWIWGGSTNTILVLALIGLVVAGLGMAAPEAIKPLFLALTLVATPIGIVLGELAMLLIYFGILLPLGMVFRVMKRDVLQLRFDRKSTTYWRPKKQPTNVASYYRQS